LGCHTSTEPAGRGFSPSDADAVTGVWATVSVGDNTTCALDQIGHAYCWGSNFRGRLGTGDIANRVTEPRRVIDAPTQFHSLSVGAHHQCAITTDGRAFCWGDNGAGQLGTGTSNGNGSAFVIGGLTFRSMTTGLEHTCALTPDDSVYCWGDNTYAQLGAGTAAPCGAMAERPCRVPVPVRVPGDLRFVQVSAGRWHTCGITRDGTAYCWGSNQHGELGDPAVPVQCSGFPALISCLRDAPNPVSGDLRFTQLSAGALHTCGVATGGAAYCWGHVTREFTTGAAELGNTAHAGFHGTEHGSQAPVRVEGGLVFREVSAGLQRSCGVTIDDRAVCWGNNNFGQLGIGTMAPRYSTRPQPVRIPVVAGAPALNESDHGCAVATRGRIWCWGGYNFFGELGSPPVSEPMLTIIIRPTPAPVGPS